MKILLVAPERAKYHERFHRFRLPRLSKPLFPPLNLCYVAASIPREINGKPIDVRLIDEAVSELDFAEKVDLIGLTANTPAAPRAYEIAAEFRRRGKTVILGGMHASACPEEAKKWVDAVCIGEAESYIHDLIWDFYRKDLKPLYRADEPPDLATQPFPRRDLLDWKKYRFLKTLDPIRGCNKRCAFCSVWKFHGGRYRMRPVNQVIEEICLLQATHPKGPLIFVSDNLAANKDWFGRLCLRLGPMKVEWFCQADTIAPQDEEIVAAASEAGCRVIFVGLESLSTANLEELNKGFNIRAQIGELTERLHRAGIAMIGAFIVGLENDTNEVFGEIIKAVQDFRIDAPQIAILIPLPGTGIGEELSNQRRIVDFDWQSYDGTKAVFQPKLMSAWEVEAGQRKCYRELTKVKMIRDRLRGHRGRLRVISWGLNAAVRYRAQKWLSGS